MKLKFTKMHGLGNDFIIINNLELQHKFSPAEIRYLADRKFGIGCDQLLLVEAATDGLSDFFYRIYNSDGSHAGQCGNGARCFIRYVHELGLINNKSQIALQTSERIIYGRMLSAERVEVNMGEPDFKTASIPLNTHEQNIYRIEISGNIIEFAALSMGNPHAVVNLNDATLLDNDEYLTTISLAFQTSVLFPQSVNVNFIYRENTSTLRLRTYERGCGFTLACGSGACASAAVIFRSEVELDSLKIKMQAGELDIARSGTDLLMRGTATKVFDGVVELCSGLA